MCIFRNSYYTHSVSKYLLLQMHSNKLFFETMVGYLSIIWNKQARFDTVKRIDSVLHSLKTYMVWTEGPVNKPSSTCWMIYIYF
jgi:hypothetical protein